LLATRSQAKRPWDVSIVQKGRSQASSREKVLLKTPRAKCPERAEAYSQTHGGVDDPSSEKCVALGARHDHRGVTGRRRRAFGTSRVGGSRRARDDDSRRMVQSFFT